MHRRLDQTAQRLRSRPTKSESLLFSLLLKNGYQVEWNQPFGPYIPDFYFPAFNKIVELDGKRFHDAERSRRRDKYFLSRHGIPTLRIMSARMFFEPAFVLRSIKAFLGDRPQPVRRQRLTAKQKKRRLVRLASAPRREPRPPFIPPKAPTPIKTVRAIKVIKGTG